MFEIDRDTVRGGKTIYGAAVGILVLDTKFPRMPGDIGYAPTWPFPVLYKVVRGIRSFAVPAESGSRPRSRTITPPGCSRHF